MALSPMAEIINNTMTQSCTVYKYTGADPTGQPIYGAGTVTKCRLAIRTERQISDRGDYVSNSTVQILLPASTEVEAYDRIDLPAGYDQGAVIREVITATDQWGQPTHKAVRIA